MPINVTDGFYSTDNYDHRLCTVPGGQVCWATWAAFGRSGSRVFARRFDGVTPGPVIALSDTEQLANGKFRGRFQGGTITAP